MIEHSPLKFYSWGVSHIGKFDDYKHTGIETGPLIFLPTEIIINITWQFINKENIELSKNTKAQCKLVLLRDRTLVEA